MIRYNVTQSFTNSTSYKIIDVTTIDSNLIRYQCACVSGSVVYMASLFNGYFLKYDTTKDFTEEDSWDFFNISAINADYKGQLEIKAIGNYIYFIP